METEKVEKWRTVKNPSKVIQAYYLEGNFYHYDNIEELANLAECSRKNVRDTLSRLRKRDERDGKYVPPPPRQQYEFRDEQRRILEETFAFGENSLPGRWTPELTREMSGKTGLTIKQVNNWLCNQRRKQDGRGNEKDRRRRLIMREEQIKKGLARSSVFSQSQLKLFEQYHFKAELAEIGGSSFKIPYGDLVEQTGQDRKKIRDWFSKRKSKDRKFAETMKNKLVENEGNVPFETNTGPNSEMMGYEKNSSDKNRVNLAINQQPNELHQSISKILSSFIFPEDRV
ncbi:hypothetical protein B9Z55_024483 [Caenorhabditis nigoni]|uniref:Homeobox domain-containing protein n=1 Tax=Caenorhabditis nigoni TaxID=1611254 RepID=A0A2G5SUW6_9PELO|nr:hypothetical protein B9Z55_024483 [Caenorhabditis nigoni]